jgi:hypothetical protein
MASTAAAAAAAAAPPSKLRLPSHALRKNDPRVSCFCSFPRRKLTNSATDRGNSAIAGDILLFHSGVCEEDFGSGGRLEEGASEI